MAAALADLGYRVLVSDPEALGAASAVLGTKAEPVPAEMCAASADVLIIATPWACYRDLPAEALRRPGSILPVIDCWRLLPPALTQIVDLIYLGRHQSSRNPVSRRATSVGGRAWAFFANYQSVRLSARRIRSSLRTKATFLVTSTSNTTCA